MSDVIVVVGSGSIGQAIARRVSAGKRVLLADLRQENAKAAAEAMSHAGFEVGTATVDVSSRESVHRLVEELTGPRGEGYRRMIELCPVGRAGTSDEVGNVGALLMGPDGAFITGSDFLMDGGVTASYFFGELAPQQGK
jgi:NAD(P)-dependent dehydrogenase (short-subunit alcohol dehydrogenase family)